MSLSQIYKEFSNANTAVLKFEKPFDIFVFTFPISRMIGLFSFPLLCFDSISLSGILYDLNNG